MVIPAQLMLIITAYSAVTWYTTHVTHDSRDICYIQASSCDLLLYVVLSLKNPNGMSTEIGWNLFPRGRMENPKMQSNINQFGVFGGQSNRPRLDNRPSIWQKLTRTRTLPKRYSIHSRSQKMAETCNSNKCIELSWNLCHTFSSSAIDHGHNGQNGRSGYGILAYGIVRDGCAVCTFKSAICRLSFDQFTFLVPSNLNVEWRGGSRFAKRYCCNEHSISWR